MDPPTSTSTSNPVHLFTTLLTCYHRRHLLDSITQVVPAQGPTATSISIVDILWSTIPEPLFRSLIPLWTLLLFLQPSLFARPHSDSVLQLCFRPSKVLLTIRQPCALTRLVSALTPIRLP